MQYKNGRHGLLQRFLSYWVESVSQIKRCVHFFGDLPIFSDVRPLFAALFPLLSPITRCSRAMQVIRDASIKSPNSTLEPAGHSLRGDRTQATQGAIISPLRSPDTERVRASTQGHESPHAPFLFPASAHLNRYDLHHNAIRITMHATMAGNLSRASDPHRLFARWLINVQCGFPIRPASITLSLRLSAPRN